MNFEEFENLEYKDKFYKEIIPDTERRKISERFEVLAERENNWDGYDSKKPTELTLVHAKLLMKELLDVISVKYPWINPFICSDEDGYITVEWYKGKRSLCFDIQEDEAQYTKLCGTGANMEIHTSSLKRDDYRKLWEWLLDG